MGSKKLLSIPISEGGLKQDAKDSLPRPTGQGLAIQICSILPPAYAEANWLFKQYPDIIQFGEIRDIFGKTIALGKWTINMLVNYKRKYTNWNGGGHGVFYETGKDYAENFENDKKQTTESDLSFLGEDPLDYGEKNTDDKEWMLWNFLNKANKIYKTIPKDQDKGNLQRYMNHVLSSAYRICSKLKKYTGEHEPKLMDKMMFDRKIPW